MAIKHLSLRRGRDRRGRKTGYAFALSAALLLSPYALHAQGTTATLNGTVTDTSGAVIPNATVTLRNAATGDIRTTKSNGAGVFSFAAVPVGNYEVDVASPGFQQFKEAGIHLDPNDQRNLHELKLTAGSEATNVTVHQADQSITLDSGEQSSLITAEDIKHLSVEGRDVTELFKILPGFSITNGNNTTDNVTYDPSQVNVTGAAGHYAAEGTEINTVATIFDGVDITDPGNFGGDLMNINYAQVAEVKVQTSSFTADEARGPIVVNAIGKSGGDHFHGSLYTYARTYQLDSTDWISNYDNQTKAPDREVYPGFTFGGPVYVPHTGFNHDHRLTFWAGAEDYAQRNVYAYGSAASALVNALVPTAAMRAGDFSQSSLNSYFGNLASASNFSSYANLTTVPQTGKNGQALTNGNIASQLDPQTSLIIDSLPLPNQAVTSANGYNWQQVNLIDDDLWQARGRIDYAINTNNKLFVAYSREAGKSGVPQVPYYSPRGPMGEIDTPGGGLLSTVLSEIGSLNYTSVLTPTLTNEFFLSGAYLDQDFVAKDLAATTLNGQYSYTGVFNNGSPVYPELGDYGYDGLPLSLTPDTSGGGIYAKKWVRTGGDNVTKVLGPHTVRLGIFVQLDDNHQVVPFVDTNGSIADYYFGETTTEPDGTVTHWTGAQGSGNGGNYLADFMEGGVQTYGQTNFAPAPNVYFWNLDGYIQDHWRLTPHLTVDYGVRFDHFTPWADAHGIGIPVWDPSTYNTGANPLEPGFLWHSIDSRIPTSGLATKWAYTEPRVGFAWDSYGNGQTVVRGGFGIYRAHDSSNDVETPAANAEGERSVSLTGPFLLSDVHLLASQYTTASFTPTSNAYGFLANDDQQPQVYTYNLAVDQKLPGNSIVEFAYIGNHSAHLLDNGSTQPVVLDDLNALPVGALFKPDPITGVTYPLLAPTGAANTNTAVNNLTTAVINQFRPYPDYSHVYVAQHNLYANYNSLQVAWNKQQGRFIYGINYTFSKALGILGADNNGTPANPFNFRDNYDPQAFDRTHIFNASYSYTFGRLVQNRFVGGVTNGWELSGITNIQSGGDIYSQDNPDFSLGGTLYVTNPTGQTGTTGVSNQDLLGTTDVYLMPRLTCNPAIHTQSHQYINNACFALPTAPGVNGPYRIPYVHGPAFTDTDLTAAKSFGLGEGRALQFRFAAFNFINHANRDLSTNVQPAGLTLTYNNGVNNYQPVAQALASATDTNGGFFGLAPLKTGRRIAEMSLNFTF